MLATFIEKKIDLIKRVPLFKGLDRRGVAELMKYIDQAPVDAGTVLRREGEKAVDLIFIVGGRGHMEKNGQYIGTVGEGDFFGQASLSQSGYEPFTVIADTPMIVLSIHKWFVQHVLKYLPAAKLLSFSGSNAVFKRQSQKNYLPLTRLIQ